MRFLTGDHIAVRINALVGNRIFRVKRPGAVEIATGREKERAEENREDAERDCFAALAMTRETFDTTRFRNNTHSSASPANKGTDKYSFSLEGSHSYRRNYRTDFHDLSN